VSGPCGVVDFVLEPDQNPVFGPCVLAGNATAVHGAMATSGRDNFANLHSPVNYVGGGLDPNGDVVTTVFTPQVVRSHPTWSQGVQTVTTRLFLNGIVNIQLPGSRVDVLFTGLLGGQELRIERSYTASGMINEQVIGDQASAESPCQP
jgi:hypothetical protein